MHHSRLVGIIIDCRDTPADEAAKFWSGALGMKATADIGDGYSPLTASGRDPHMAVQSVKHESRVHLDLETDDEAAEVARLEKLGAKKIEKVKTWTVMEAPTGQRFCVCQANTSLDGKPGLNTWP